MSQTLTLSEIPADKVAEVEADMTKWGATDVEKTPEEDGTFTIVATFPD
jgi:hypothetical protein